jgi:hypothetical protein
MIGFCNIQNIPQNAGMCLGPAKHLTYDADHVGPCREPIRLGRDGHPLHDYLASPGWRTTPFTPELTRTRFSSSEGCSGTVLAHYEACHGSPTMDNWGDPWADNADNAKSPTKPAVTSPLPPSFAPPPAFLGGFVDDAGWGNEDESFGDWSTATAKDAGEPAPIPFSATESLTSEQPLRFSDDTQWDSGRELDHSAQDGGDWGAVKPDAPQDEERVLSEASDSSTTVPASEVIEDIPPEASARPHPDDGSSTRTSTSPSEASHNEVLVESPRTSYEEERGVAKEAAVEQELAVFEDSSVQHRSAGGPESESSGDDTDADQETAQIKTPANESEEVTESALKSSNRTSGGVLDTPVATHAPLSPDPGAFKVDANLIDELFAPSKDSNEAEDAPGDPIYSTSARKAWYRLTRKQTMREFNHGNDDDNYIRVTWGISNIRSEVNKVVGRWAREDRISGTGPGARASFYWDTPASVDLQATHNRQRPSVSAAHTNLPIKESVPALSTNLPAAFNWSSASVSADPWQEASPGLRSTSSPITPMHPNLTQVKKQEARAVSLDLTSQEPDVAKQVQISTSTRETPVVAPLISPPTTNITVPVSDPLANIKTLDVASASKDDIFTAPVDDDDEWGEMVSTPIVSTPTLTELTSQFDTRNNNLSTTANTPQSIRSLAIRDHSPDTMHATPIVRLKSTISPTSAYFKPNIFVPLTVEQGPIGPGLLKPTKRSISNPKKPEEKEATKPEQVLKSVTLSEDVPKPDAPDDFSAWQTSMPITAAKEEQEKQPDDFSAWQTLIPNVAAKGEQEKEILPNLASPIIEETIRPSTPPAPIAATAEANIDAWADADFSFFESSLPTAPPSQPKSDPSDPFSAFETRGRSTSAASSAKTFTRSPPRKVTPPPVQPLTSATSSAQRRKTIEDGVIHDILRGLPDLGYMLR